MTTTMQEEYQEAIKRLEEGSKKELILSNRYRFSFTTNEEEHYNNQEDWRDQVNANIDLIIRRNELRSILKIQ